MKTRRIKLHFLSAALLLIVVMFSSMSVTGRDVFFDDGSGATDRPQDTFPVPVGNPQQLFYLQRTPNSNTIVYELNLDEKGQLNEEDPVHVFWIRYPEGGMRKELSYIQRKFAYGVRAERIGDGRYKLIFAAYKQKNLYLVYAPRDNKYHVYTSFGSKVVILNRVFIKINPGGSFWSPNVEYIEMKGNEPGKTQDFFEKIMIAKN